MGAKLGCSAPDTSVTFTYFPLKARGFPILLALEVGKVDYNVSIVQMSDWAAMKESGVCPFGYLPLLELPDGTRVNETNACLVAAGVRGNLLGSTEADQVKSAMLACKSAEVFTEFTNVQPTMFNVDKWDTEKRAALGKWAMEKNALYMQQFEDLCNAEGKFTADGNTIGELSLFHLLYHQKACGFASTMPPKLKKFYDRLLDIPEVKKCCENGTKMGELADYVVHVPRFLASSEELSSFTNDSAMMIAYERALESSRPDALFQDPFAKILAGNKGQTLSAAFEGNCQMFEFPEWPEFHKMWTAVRTKFIDDRIAQFAATGTFPQLVNLGAGVDTRAHRLESYKAFTNGSFEVDMETINVGKAKVFQDFLGTPKPHCSAVHTITLDFLDAENTLSSELKKQAAFDPTKPTLFVAEGLIMYLGAVGKLKLIDDVSATAAPGSVFILQYMDASDSEAAKDNPAALQHALSIDEATRAFTSNGWSQLEFSHYGDEKLNFGRFPNDRFKPSKSFSFVVCVKS